MTGIPAATLSILVTASTKQAQAALKAVDAQGKTSALHAHGVESGWQKAGKAIGTAAKYGAVGMAGLGAASVVAAAKFESSFAEVRKTVETSEAGFKNLETGIRNLAKTIPVSVNELNELAGQAGALGIKSRDLLEFTRTAAELGIATDMSSDEAANALARISNIMGTSRKDFRRLASTFVDLGNKGASTEAEIAAMSLRLASAGRIVGLTEAQVLAFSSALASVGIRAEAGGSAFSKAFITMYEAVDKGGDKLAAFAETAGMSSGAFRKAFEQDAATAMIAFTEGLERIRKSGGSVFEILDSLDLDDIRVGNSLRAAATSGELFREALKTGSEEWKRNVALTHEANQRYKTTAAQWQLLKNRANDLLIALGQKLLPEVKKLMQILGNPKLTFDEKVEKVMDMASRAFTAGLTLMAEQAAHNAPQVVLAFVKGFLNADIWGKLAVGGFLLAKFGGIGAFGKLGSKAGRAWGTGFVAALLVMELAKQIKQIIEGHKLDAPTREVFAMKLGDFFAAPKVTFDLGGQKVRLATQLGDLIFNAQTQKIIGAKGEKLQQFVGQTLGSKFKASFDRVVLDSRKGGGRVTKGFMDGLHPLPERAGKVAAGVNRQMLPKLDRLVNQGGQKGDAFAGRVSGSFGNLDTNVGRAIQSIIDNTKRALGALGVGGALKQFALKHPSFVYGSGTSPNLARQRGGFIVPGTGSGDTFRTALPAGSFILNREAAKAAGFAKGGLMPVALEPGERAFLPSEVKAYGQRNLEAANSAVKRFQQGGQLGKPQITGPAGPLLDMGRGAVDKVHEAAARFLDRQRPAGDVGLGNAPASLRAAMALAKAMGLTITSTTGGTHVADSWHYKGRAFDAADGAAAMRQFALGVAKRWGKTALELFYDPLGWYIKNGQKISGAIGGHSDHVHTAMQRGGLLQRLLQGGWVRTGYTTYDEDGPGAFGDLMKGMGYAELGTATRTGAATGHGYIAQLLGRSGELSRDYPLDVKIGSIGKIATLFKRDRGFGQGTSAYSIDIHRLAWAALGLAGNSKGTAFIRDLGGGTGSEGEKTRREAEHRKARHESTLQQLRQRVAAAKTEPAKQSALWKLMKFWGRVGIFDKGERSHILEKVQEAASKINPEGTVRVLSHLAGYARKTGEITGRDPDDFHSLVKAMEKAQERGQKQRERTSERLKRRQARRAARIAGKGNFPGWTEMLGGMENAFNLANQAAERLVALEPENLTDAYVGQERGAWVATLDRLAGWRDTVVTARDFATSRIPDWEGRIEKIKALWPKHKKAFQKQKWRIPALREAIVNARAFIGERGGEIQDFQGFGGPQGVLGSLGEGTPWWLTLGAPGARIFDTQKTIQDLGLKGVTGDDERIARLEQLLREANQRNAVFMRQSKVIDAYEANRGRYAGAFAAGGFIPPGMWGIAGETGRPEVVQGPAQVYSPSESATMLGASPVEVRVLVLDGAVDPNKIRTVVNGEIKKANRSAGRGAKTIGARVGGRIGT